MTVAHLIVRFAHISRLPRLFALMPTLWTVKSADRQRVICATGLAVQRARRLFLGDAKCLSSAATSTCLLRLRGLPAQMIIGVRRSPFEAHAWTELDGSVINDDVAETSTYQVMTRL